MNKVGLCLLPLDPIHYKAGPNRGWIGTTAAMNLPAGVSSNVSSCVECDLVPKSSCRLGLGGKACADVAGVDDFSILCIVELRIVVKGALG